MTIERSESDPRLGCNARDRRLLVSIAADDACSRLYEILPDFLRPFLSRSARLPFGIAFESLNLYQAGSRPLNRFHYRLHTTETRSSSTGYLAKSIKLGVDYNKPVPWPELADFIRNCLKKDR